MQIMENENKQQKFDGILAAGLILGIIVSSSLIALLSCLIIYFLWSASVLAPSGLGELFSASLYIIVILFLILMIGPIANLIVTVRFYRGKTDNKTAVGVLNIFFGGIISGIFILAGAEQPINV